MFLLVLKYDGDNSEAKIGYAMMALEAYGCKVNHKSNYDFYRIKQKIDRKQPVYSVYVSFENSGGLNKKTHGFVIK